MKTTDTDVTVTLYSPAYPVSPEMESRIEADLVTGMPNFGIAQYFSVKKDELFSCDCIAVAEAEDRVAGIWALKFYLDEAVPFVHSYTTLIGESFQGSNLLRKMFRTLFAALLERNVSFPCLIALKTYNTQTYNALAVLTRIPGVRIYPDIASETIAADLNAQAEVIAEILEPGLTFDRASGAIRNGGGKVSTGFYKTFPECSKESINDYFRTHLGSNDRLLCLVAMDGQGRSSLKRMFGL